MKKILSIILSLSISIVLFISCSNDSTPPILPIIPPVSPTSSTAPVIFDFSNAKAIAHMGDANSRAASDTDEYVKILTDGTFETAIKLTGTGTLSKIVGIYPSPTTSGEVFVVFDSISYLRSGYISQSIGQLICVHSDGTYDDVLKIANNTMVSWTNYLELTTSSLTFDQNGNLYFFATKRYDSNGNSITNAGQQIYQYKPSEKQLNKLVAAVEGTSYDRMQISSDSSLIFAQGKRWNNSTCTSFIRAIPVADAGNFVNIYYGPAYFDPNSSPWVYDDRNAKFYYYGTIGNESGLHVFTRANNFNDDTVVAKNATKSVPGLFQKFFSNNIGSNELIEKLSAVFKKDIKIVVNSTSYTNANGQNVQLFTELGSTSYENTEALNWLKAESSRQTALLNYIDAWLDSNNLYLNCIKYYDDLNNYWVTLNSSYYSVGFSNLSVNTQGLYSWETSGNKISLVHITDENGNYIYDVVKRTLPVTGIIKETKQHGTKIFMKYSLTNSNNVELGYHHIYSVDFQNNTLSNYFDAFTNKNTMEVVSYSVGADNLYFSFVNGLNVENYVIDLSTNNARRLETNRKMLDVFAF